jgi:dynein heavy chain
VCCVGADVVYLGPLQRYLEKLSLADEFGVLADLFKPVMHTVLLIWKHSKYYNTAARLVILVREICNDIIMQVRHADRPAPCMLSTRDAAT